MNSSACLLIAVGLLGSASATARQLGHPGASVVSPHCVGCEPADCFSDQACSNCAVCRKEHQSGQATQPSSGGAGGQELCTEGGPQGGDPQAVYCERWCTNSACSDCRCKVTATFSHSTASLLHPAARARVERPRSSSLRLISAVLFSPPFQMCDFCGGPAGVSSCVSLPTQPSFCERW